MNHLNMGNWAKLVVFGPLVISIVFLAGVAVGKTLKALGITDQES